MFLPKVFHHWLLMIVGDVSSHYYTLEKSHLWPYWVSQIWASIKMDGYYWKQAKACGPQIIKLGQAPNHQLQPLYIRILNIYWTFHVPNTSHYKTMKCSYLSCPSIKSHDPKILLHHIKAMQPIDSNLITSHYWPFSHDHVTLIAIAIQDVPLRGPLRLGCPSQLKEILVAPVARQEATQGPCKKMVETGELLRLVFNIRT